MRDLYVSTSGSDVAGGGSLGAPFATIEFAQAQALARGMTDDCAINIAPGIYRPAAILSHGPQYSGRNGGRLRYLGTGRPGTARILGSTRVTGWTLHSGSIWKATIGTTPIHTLYEDGFRAIKARWPKYSFQSGYPMGRSPYIRAEGVAGAGSAVVQYPAGSMDPTLWGSLTGLECVITSGGSFAWFDDVVPVQSTNTGTRQMTLTRAPRYDIFSGGGARFYVQNNLTLLTQAGEFFHDTAAGILYYWPRKPGDPNLFAIERPRLKRIFEFVGTDPSTRTSSIELNGLQLAFTDFTNDYMFAWKAEGDSGEGHTYGGFDRIVTRPVHRQGPVVLQDADSISIANCEIAGAGYVGIYGYGYNQNHRIENFWIHGCGVGGIMIDGRYPGEGDFSRGNYIGNGSIGNCGELVCHGVGVALTNSGFNVTEHVDIAHTSGEAYTVRSYSFAGGGFPAPPPSALYANGNVFRLSRIRAAGQNRGDMGAIYNFGLGAGNSNLAENIDIDTVQVTPDMYDVAPDGIFSDNDAGGQRYRNVSMRTIQGQNARENGVESVGHENYDNVQGVTSFNQALMATGLGPDTRSVF